MEEGVTWAAPTEKGEEVAPPVAQTVEEVAVAAEDAVAAAGGRPAAWVVRWGAEAANAARSQCSPC